MNKSNSNIEYLKKHYNKYSYPPDNFNIEDVFIKNKSRHYNDITFNWHKIWPEKNFSNQKLNILVAGCGTREAVLHALCNPHHDFIGVDLSKKSIQSSNELKNKFKLKNLELFCDDFRRINFKKKFSYIICTGVIHHLDDPNTALDYFKNILEEDGVLSLMVYGDKIRHSLIQVKKVLSKLPINLDSKSIDFANNFFNSLNLNHPARIYAENTNDIKFDSGIADLILHKSEKFYSIENLISSLNKSDLTIKNFEGGNIKSLSKFFLGNQKYISILRNLEPEMQWSFGQILNWNDSKISLYATHKKNIKYSIAYNFPDLSKIFICYRTEINYKIINNKLLLKLKNNEEYHLDVPKVSEEILIKALEGQIQINEILSKLDNNQLDDAKEFFTLLIENVFVDISFHKISKERLIDISI